MPPTDLVAILVTDLVDSTGIRARVGEERADELQRIHDAILRDTVIASHGEVVKGTGDGVMACFHSTTDALGAAVGMQQQFETYSARADAIAPIAIRVGMSVGDVVHQDGDIFGTAVIEAARLESAAETGQILCSELVRTLARGRGGFDFELVGLLELKGLPEPVAACEVLWERVEHPERSALPFPPSLESRGRMRFVGRDSEVSSAVGLTLGAEHAHALWLLGEPGIGKTRLASEVAARAYAAGARVLYGRCDELVPDPFQPIIQALRFFVANTSDDELRASLGVDPEPLARLVPELATRVPALSTSTGRTTEVEQYRLFESVRSWLQATSSTTPLALVIDDVHWADRPTLALLAHTLRSSEPARLVVIGTARSTDPDASVLLADLADDLARTGRSTSVELVGLDPSEIATLLATTELGEHEPTEFAAHLAVETAGNPLFVTAVLAGLAAGARGQSGIPADVRSAVSSRTRGLDEPIRARLQIAGLIGLEFPLRLTAAVAGVSEAECLTSIEQAAGAGLVEELDVDRFRFTHALVRDALVEELSASRRARLHQSIAATIEREYGATLEEHYRPLAHHYGLAAGQESIAKALDYARQSARVSTDLLAFDAAVADYTLALDLASRLDRADNALRYQLLIEKGRAERTASRHAAALATLRTAAELARREQDWPAFARAAIDFEETSWRPGLLGHDAVALLRDASQHELDPKTMVTVRASLSRALHFSGAGAPATLLAREAVAEAREIGDQALLTHALCALAQSLGPFEPMHVEEVTECISEMWSFRQATDNISALSTATDYGAELQMLRGDRAATSEWLERSRTLVEMSGMRFDRYVHMSILQIVAFYEGDLALAEQRATENLEFGRELGEDTSGTHGVQMFLIRREQGRLQELEPAVRLMVRTNPTGAMWQPGLVLMLAELGMDTEARELLDDLAAQGLARLPHDAMYPAALSMFAQAAWKARSRAIAPLLLERLGVWSGMGVSVGHTCAYLGSADRYLGLLERLQGRPENAARHLAAAREHERGLGAETWVAHSLAESAELAIEQGELSAARPFAKDARLLAQRHGLAAVARQLDDLPID
jgi:class 3 adenylate cyclase/tetratricopeptide (TPR) repeat protein